MSALGIRPSALPAWRTLHDALAVMDGPTPCAADPDSWADPPDRETAEYAANLCMRCPVVTQCIAFAIANDETGGIYGGMDRTPKRGRPAAQQEMRTA